jgi:hypothetical protein
MKATPTKCVIFKQPKNRLCGSGDPTDLIGKRRQAERKALALETIALAVEWLVQPDLLNASEARKCGPNMARGVTWKGAGGCVMV